MQGQAVSYAKPERHRQLEVCVEDITGLLAAERGGADRVELCSALQIGGVTPSRGFVQRAANADVDAAVLIRPRPGGFTFDPEEVAIMLDDISFARECGLEGVVVGASRPDHTLDVSVLEKLCAAAGPLNICLHRVFDLVPDPFEAIDIAVQLGISRILTSGQQPDISRGIEMLARLVIHADHRLEIMSGGGVNPGNVAAILAAGINHVHSSCSWDYEQPAEDLVSFGFSGKRMRKPVRVQNVRSILLLLNDRKNTVGQIASAEPFETGAQLISGGSA